MPNKMLIDATHPEETRVVVLRGNRVEEFDFESANRKQLRGNIYLAKVTRVEPSLQAAFVDYGGNRHGFLAFSEIHPDYYQIPGRRPAGADRRGGARAARRRRRSRQSRAPLRARAPCAARARPRQERSGRIADESGAMAAGSEMMAPAARLGEPHAHGGDGRRRTRGDSRARQREAETQTTEGQRARKSRGMKRRWPKRHPKRAPDERVEHENGAPHIDSPETAASGEPHEASEAEEGSEAADTARWL